MKWTDTAVAHPERGVSLEEGRACDEPLPGTIRYASRSEPFFSRMGGLIFREAS